MKNTMPLLFSLFKNVVEMSKYGMVLANSCDWLIITEIFIRSAHSKIAIEWAYSSKDKPLKCTIYHHVYQCKKKIASYYKKIITFPDASTLDIWDVLKYYSFQAISWCHITLSLLSMFEFVQRVHNHQKKHYAYFWLWLDLKNKH